VEKCHFRKDAGQEDGAFIPGSPLGPFQHNLVRQVKHRKCRWKMWQSRLAPGQMGCPYEGFRRTVEDQEVYDVHGSIGEQTGGALWHSGLMRMFANNPCYRLKLLTMGRCI
jgi:hypothetical protein